MKILTINLTLDDRGCAAKCWDRSSVLECRVFPRPVLWLAEPGCVSDHLGTGVTYSWDGMFGSKVDQIGPKWDKSGAFSDQISVHLARGAKCTEI